MTVRGRVGAIAGPTGESSKRTRVILIAVLAIALAVLIASQTVLKHHSSGTSSSPSGSGTVVTAPVNVVQATTTTVPQYISTSARNPFLKP